jgi:hypothetical protein
LKVREEERRKKMAMGRTRDEKYVPEKERKLLIIANASNNT